MHAHIYELNWTITRQDLRVHEYAPTHTSSPSLRTMVPARSTTAKTMTAQSSLLTDMVMLANAGSWCMNSSNCSARGTKERQQRSLGKASKRHLEERKRASSVACTWQVCTALNPASKWIITTIISSQRRNHYVDKTKPNINSIDKNFKASEENCWQFTQRPLCDLRELLKTMNQKWNHSGCAVREDQAYSQLSSHISIQPWTDMYILHSVLLTDLNVNILLLA